MTDKKEVPLSTKLITALTAGGGLAGLATTAHGREIIAQDAKAIQAGVSYAVTGVEDALVNFADTLGGPAAAAHQRAAMNAVNKGHLGENLTEALRADVAVVAHVTGHDHKPLETPAGPRTSQTKAK